MTAYERMPVFPGEWLEEEQLELGLMDGRDTPKLDCPICDERNTFLVWCDRFQQFVCEDCYVEGQITFWGS